MLGLNHYSLGNQIRSAFFGIEVQRIQRKSNDLKVMLRYPKEERLSISDLDNLIINLPNGEKTILSEVAEYNLTESLSTIRRINQKNI